MENTINLHKLGKLEHFHFQIRLLFFFKLSIDKGQGKKKNKFVYISLASRFKEYEECRRIKFLPLLLGF